MTEVYVGDQDKAKQATIFVHRVMEQLCTEPLDLVTEFKIDEKGVLINAYANKVDCGRLIGKKGVTINAIRTLLAALGTHDNAHYALKIDSLDQKNATV